MVSVAAASPLKGAGAGLPWSKACARRASKGRSLARTIPGLSRSASSRTFARARRHLPPRRAKERRPWKGASQVLMSSICARTANAMAAKAETSHLFRLKGEPARLFWVRAYAGVLTWEHCIDSRHNEAQPDESGCSISFRSRTETQLVNDILPLTVSVVAALLVLVLGWSLIVRYRRHRRRVRRHSHRIDIGVGTDCA